MQKSHGNTSALLSLLSLALFLMLGALQLQATTVNYSTLPTGNLTSPFDLNGVTATSTGTMDIGTSFSTGLGVVGGLSNALIDNSESVKFSFDAGAASSVTLFINVSECVNSGCSNWVFPIQGFGVGGASLGTQLVSAPPAGTKNISALFGNVDLSGFTVGEIRTLGYK